ncbi:PREDICTED: uncharacterized protein LOC106299470 [Brassica oleracea var. oleracea]|uniref:uncharacterized protein LOC106299470 n=1 Tax=Brassica oleracea var. oleracea TaxID=109376 RepID=UPI0006A7059B|nr:PREDICTED: uncharacterized protein LOC106299470 [Brassica oleracea var. oleracea]
MARGLCLLQDRKIKCPTRDRLHSWGMQTPTTCLLCNSADETRDHLLFGCPFSFCVWTIVASRCLMAAVPDWNSTLLRMQTLPKKSNASQLSLWCWQTAIYLIWTERNARLHRKTFRSKDSLIKQLDHLIRNKISSIRPSNQRISSSLMQLWLSTS